MTKLKLAILSIFIFCFISCSKDEVKIAKIKKKSQELEMITVYNDAYKKLEINDTYNAAQKFLELRIRRFPVLKEGRLVGQISLSDVIRAFPKLNQTTW